LALAVLGLLIEKPMHPYEMVNTLLDRNKDASIKITKSSLYDIVDTLNRLGWIEEQAVERDGRRPERTVYTQTELGNREFIRWLDELVRTPTKEYPKFLTAVGYLGALGRDGAGAALAERRDRLSVEAEATRTSLTEILGTGVPRLFVIEMEYALQIINAELSWVTEIISDIEDGTLGWPQQHMVDGQAVWTTTDSGVTKQISQAK
jgi:DNA-binding PadR family transcriptional regulator